LSKLWKLIPIGLRWRAIRAVSPRFVVGVSGIVLNERGEVLLAHHVYRTEYPWGPPGGMIHYREGLREALRRELFEETHLLVEVGPLLQVSVGERWPHLTFHFLCTVAALGIGGSPQPQVTGELFEAGFYPPDALPWAIEPAYQSALAAALDLHRHPESPIEVRLVGMD
jgi:ADP-ribose pyrophosphatase YjhB (NUDIX family)